MKDLSPLSLEAKTLQIGTYEHYKGLQYQVLAVARNEATLEEVVVYKGLYGEQDVWVRPLKSFLETMAIEGRDIPRFRFLEKT